MNFTTLFVGGMDLLYNTMWVSDMLENKMKDYDMEIIPPVDTVSIIMPSFNEEKFIEKAASSIRCQSVLMKYPDMFEFIVIDGGSTDRTVELAAPFADKVIIFDKKGKLSARNYATEIASGNIIVSVDADAYYPFGWVNTLLKPFNDNTDKSYMDLYNDGERVVGVSGPILDYNLPNIPTTLSVISLSLHRVIEDTRMLGMNCAYLKDAFYDATGGFGFNEDINQLDVKQMLEEEEYGFGKKLSAVGKVKYVFNAGMVHLGGMKVGCRMGFADKSSPECQSYKIGIERFG